MAPVSKPTLPAGTDLSFAELLDGLEGGHIYLGEGSYADIAAVKAAFSDQDVAAATLAAGFISMGELAENPGKANSKAEKKKTYHYIKEGKRTNVVELHLSGVTEEQKNYLESSLNSTAKTIVVQSDDLSTIVVFNGLKWTADWDGEFDDYWDWTINTEFNGATAAKIVPLQCDPAA